MSILDTLRRLLGMPQRNRNNKRASKNDSGTGYYDSTGMYWVDNQIHSNNLNQQDQTEEHHQTHSHSEHQHHHSNDSDSTSSHPDQSLDNTDSSWDSGSESSGSDGGGSDGGGGDGGGGGE